MDTRHFLLTFKYFAVPTHVPVVCIYFNAFLYHQDFFGDLYSTWYIGAINIWHKRICNCVRSNFFFRIHGMRYRKPVAKLMLRNYLRLLSFQLGVSVVFSSVKPSKRRVCFFRGLVHLFICTVYYVFAIANTKQKEFLYVQFH